MHDRTMLSWQEALEINVAKTGFKGYRKRCDESHPDHEKWRSTMIQMASEDAPQYPPITTTIGNAIGAIGRVAEAAIAGKPILAKPEEVSRRLAICESNVCSKYDTAQKRCMACGCFTQAKAALETERGKCPAGLW